VGDRVENAVAEKRSDRRRDHINRKDSPFLRSIVYSNQKSLGAGESEC